MITISTIKKDLKDIRYYFSRKELFEKALLDVGANEVLEKIKIYNDVVRSASPKLYDIYVSLYLSNLTQENLSEILGYTSEHISRLNSQLLNFFLKKLTEKEVKANDK